MSADGPGRPLEALVERARDLVCVVDADGRIAYLNPAVRRLLGWTPAEVTGRFLLNFVHPEDVQRIASAYAAATPAVPHVELLHRVRARDRSWRWLDVRAVVCFTDSGAVEAIELTGRDVTERRAAETERRRDAARLATLVGTATGGIVMEDADRRITVVSQAFCSMFGIPAHSDALVGTDAPAALAAVRRQLADSASAVDDHAVVLAAAPVRGHRLRLADGRTIERDYVPIGERAAEGHLWIFRDVTPAQRLEAELRQARDAAVAAATSKSEFIATMSHEIRTPLSGISGAAALLLDAGLPDAEQELAGIVADAAEALGGLLGDVLDVSRIEAGHVELEERDYDPRRLLQAVAGILRPTLAGRPLALEVAVEAAVPANLYGDAGRVRQIVFNLAGNAVKYTEQGRVRLTASVTADGRLRVSVADTGPGISDELLQRLFDPWTRGHGREWAGTGLGLGIARRLARAMHGDVTAVSVPGEGSTFTLELPLVEGVPVAAPAASGAADLSGTRVLVAEDNHALRLLLGRQLARLGVEATVVADGEAAVRALGDAAFDVVLLDLRMPVLGGLEAARRIRAREAAEGAPRRPILALTADTSAEDVAQCLAVGMDGHLAKPVGLEALRRALAQRLAPAPLRPTPAIAPPPLLDVEQLDELADGLGGRDALDGLLVVFRHDLRTQLDELGAAVEAAEPLSVSETAHALRSGAAAFGAKRLAERTRGLERAARRGQLEGARDALAGIAEVVADTDAALLARLGA